MMFRSLLMLSGSMAALQAALAVSLAEELAAGESQALAFDFTDDFWEADTGHYGSAYVLDTGTPANNYDSHPYGKLTYTSPSAKMTMGPTGSLRFGAHNLVTESQTVASWLTKTGVTGTNASATTPGGVPAARIVETAATSFHFTRPASITAINGAAYRITVDMKYDGRQWIAIEISGSADCRAWFDVQNGATGGTSGSAANHTIESLGDGWYRCGVTNSAIDATSLTPGLLFSTADGAVASYAGSTSNAIYATRAHVYRTPSDSTYLATTSAARYALPHEWDSAGNPLGGPGEDARTNLLTYSNTLSNAAWTQSGGVSTEAQNITSPEGASTAWDIIENGLTNEKSYYHAGPNSSATRTTSVYLKQSGRRYATVTVSSDFAARFDLQTGTVDDTYGAVTASIVDVGNGWYRCIVTATAVNDYVLVIAGDNSVSLATIRGSDSYFRQPGLTGLSGSSLYFYGIQLEAGSFPTSYIPTLGSTVTRAEDNESNATSAFPWSATAGSLVVSGRTAQDSGTQVVAQVDDGTENERIRIVRDSSNDLRFIVTDGGVEQCNINLGAVANDTDFRVAVAWAANDFAASLNGGAASTDGTGTLPTCTTLRYGRGATANSQFGGRLKQFMYVPRRIANADLAVESAP